MGQVELGLVVHLGRVVRAGQQAGKVRLRHLPFSLEDMGERGQVFRK